MTVHHHQRPMPDLPDDVVLSVRNVSKKFCRNLRRSMWYGMQDLGRSLLGLRPSRDDGRQTTDYRPEDGAGGVQRSELPQSVVRRPSSVVPSSSGLRRDEFWALQDINFELRRGECLGLIGQNGSGKSTLLRLLTGIFPPNAGEIAVRGRVGALIALGAGFHPHMTGRENIYLNGSILGMDKGEIARQFDDIVEFAELGEFIDAPVATYSSGMTVRLGFAIAVHTSPDLLLIDEVFAVGDIGFRIKCLNRIENLINRCSVVFVSHSMSQIAAIATHVMVLEHGRIAFYSNDVAAGIEGYFKEFDSGLATHIGDGRVKLKATTVSVPGRIATEPVLKIRRGEDLHVGLEMEIDRRIPQVHVRIGIVNLEMRSIAEADTEVEQFCVRNTPPMTRVSVVISGLSLNSGRYSVHVHVTDVVSGERYLRAGCVAEFQSAFLASSGADFMLPCKWSQE